MTGDERPAVRRAAELGALLKASRTPAWSRSHPEPPQPAVLVWLTATLTDLEKEIQAEEHDDDPDTGGCGWMPSCDLAEDEHDLCSCGLVHRRAWALHSIDVDRALLDEHDATTYGGFRSAPVCSTCAKGTGCGCCSETVPAPCRHVLLVASRYRHRNGYRSEWAP